MACSVCMCFDLLYTHVLDHFFTHVSVGDMLMSLWHVLRALTCFTHTCWTCFACMCLCKSGNFTIPFCTHVSVGDRDV